MFALLDLTVPLGSGQGREADSSSTRDCDSGSPAEPSPDHIAKGDVEATDPDVTFGYVLGEMIAPSQFVRCGSVLDMEGHGSEGQGD